MDHLASINLDVKRPDHHGVAFCESRGSCNRAVVIKSTYPQTPSVRWPHSPGFWLVPGTQKWSLIGWSKPWAGEKCEESCVGAGGRINRAWIYKAEAQWATGETRGDQGTQTHPSHIRHSQVSQNSLFGITPWSDGLRFSIFWLEPLRTP